MRAVALFVTPVVLAATLCGCASQPDVAPSALIGKSVSAANDLVAPGRSYAWYDLTSEVLHKHGTLIGGAEPDGAGGVIVAVCADASTIGKSSKVSAGAIPATDYSDDLRRKAEAGEFRALLPECAAK